MASRDKLKPKTPNHALYFDAIDKSTITICTGPAGTGKTYIACGKAAEALRSKRVEKILLCRPLVQCRNSKDDGLGFLPGTLEEKVGPYMRPLMDAFEEFFQPKELEKLLYDGVIKMEPLELLRGASLKRSFIILDEAQNASFAQLKMFLTRLDHGSKIVVTGDAGQADLSTADGGNPFSDVVARLKDNCHRAVRIVKLTRRDVMRPELVRWLDERLSEPSQEEAVEWQDIACPDCEAKLYFDAADAAANSLIKCWNCFEAIEMYDERHHLSPIVVEPDPEDIVCQSFESPADAT